MKHENEDLREWLLAMAALIDENADPEPMHYSPFLHEPDLALQLVEILEGLSDDISETEQSFYSACIFALDICVAQLQAAREHNSKGADKLLNQLMDKMARLITNGSHSLSFWLPVLNAFYDVHVELSPALRDAYLSLAEQEEIDSPEEDFDHLESIRAMIKELGDLSPFDIAENFFAQSYAMPPDFFTDLLADLYSIEEGQEVAMLMLLHPKWEVREVVVATMAQIIESITLTPKELTRLEVIKQWYGGEHEALFNQWIKQQRLKGVVFDLHPEPVKHLLKASEVDGSGAQGIFIHIQKPRANRLCGLLLKDSFGIKDAWLTPVMPAREVNNYFSEAFDESVTLRDIDLTYLQRMVNHFLSLTIEAHRIPDLHLLEIQEQLNIHFKPEKLDMAEEIANLAVTIAPFTQTTIDDSLKRSQSWTRDKSFTESWFVESATVDKIVNRHSGFVEGTRVCDTAAAMKEVFAEELETHRQQWMFHFLWTAMWLKSRSKKNEKTWLDSFVIAYEIQQKRPLVEIPLFMEICRQTVINSIETMNARRTHLT